MHKHTSGAFNQKEKAGNLLPHKDGGVAQLRIRSTFQSVATKSVDCSAKTKREMRSTLLLQTEREKDRCFTATPCAVRESLGFPVSSLMPYACSDKTVPEKQVMVQGNYFFLLPRH